MALRRLGSDKTGWATTVWIDPGGTTGWGVMSITPEDLIGDKPLHVAIAHWACGDTKGNENQMASACLELFAMWDDAAIGCEKFVIRKFLQHAEFLSPVRIRSKIEYGLWLAEKWEADDEEREEGRPRQLFVQDPSYAKSTLTDDRQRNFGLWEPGGDDKRDAIKHCYAFLSRARQTPRLRYLAWPNLFRTDGTPLKQRASAQKKGIH